MKVAIAILGRKLPSAVSGCKALKERVNSVSRALGLLTAVLGVAMFGAGSVQAQEVQGKVCNISGYLIFADPLTEENVERSVYGEATIAGCVDENGPVADAEAEVVIAGSGPANCALQSFSLTQLVEWKSGALDFATLGPAIEDRAPIGAYKGSVEFGESAGRKVIATLFNEEPVNTLKCLLKSEPLETFNFSGVQMFVQEESASES